MGGYLWCLRGPDPGVSQGQGPIGQNVGVTRPVPLTFCAWVTRVKR